MPIGVYIIFLSHCVDERGARDVVYTILGYLVFAVAVEMPFIAYREPPPPGGYNYPPDPPHKQGGGAALPPQPPLQCAPTR